MTRRGFPPLSLSRPDGSRRRFVQGFASGAAVLAAGGVLRATGSEPQRNTPSGATASRGDPGQAVLQGSQFDLEITSRMMNVTGEPRTAVVVNGRIPAPLLCWREGDTITVRVTNRLTTPTSIHWHGMVLPAGMDGVPGVSFPGIRPGETFTYRFPVRQAGTYWYHSHSRFQEQVGLYGPIVIAPRDGERHRADREHVVLLSDWSDTDPEQIYRTLKRESDYFNHNRRTASDFLADAREQGLRAALRDRRMWGRMRMNPTDLLDVSGHAYTYLLNGVTPAGNWTGQFRRGERIRLRVINGSSMSFFDVRIPGLKLTVIAADGQDIEPVEVDEFRIGAAEVYDVMVEPREERAYTIFAQAMDRTGYARGTLAPAPGMTALIPSLDPRPVLTMADMGDMSRMGGMQPGMDMSHMPGMDNSDMQGMQTHAHEASGGRRDFGPNVDDMGMKPTDRLDDPGIGLRHNGRRVLTYADLRTLGGPIDSRPPGREIRLHLTGHMQRFVWSFDGQKFSESVPLRFEYGERLRIILVNDSMMTHPIHLHGMWSELENSRGEFLVRKHTVVVQPAQELAYAVSANAPGRWAFHCHLLYHMEAGMFREVNVESSG